MDCKASIRGLQGKRISLGYFPDAVSAAKKYDKAATEYWGPTAILNFPDGDNSNPTLGGAHNPSVDLPLGRGRGLDGPTTFGQLLPANAVSTLASRLETRP